MRFHVCVIGHVTRDIIRTGRAVMEAPGGTAYYTSMALRGLGLTVAVITRVSEKDQDYLLGELKESGITVFYRKSKETTVFENIYQEDNLNYRVQKVRAVASPFSSADLEDVDASIFHFGPLSDRDIAPALLRYVHNKGALVSLDVQGFLRRIEHGEVIEKDWEEKREGLSCVDILKADEREARLLSGEDNIEDAVSGLSKFGPKEVIITLGSSGSLISAGGRLYRIQAFTPERIADPTGCGDTYMAGYLFQRLQGRSPEEAGGFAARVATLKLAIQGPFRGRLNNQNPS